MADVHDKATRSYNMSQIKGKNTKPEILVRRFLFSNGFRYRLHDKKLPGKPDIVLRKYKTVIFVHGCYWHRHEGCSYCTFPKSNTEFWINKFEGTKIRDKIHREKLEESGWKVIVIWECQLRRDNIQKTFENLLTRLKNEDANH